MIPVIASQVGLLLGLLALGLVALSLARQIGVLHERTAPVGGLLQKARQEAAKVDRIDLDAVRVATAAGFAGPLRQLCKGRAIALLFVSEECAVCKSLLLSYEAALGRYEALPLVLVGGAASSDLGSFAELHGLRPDRVLASSELAVALQVMQTPTLVLLDPDGRLLERVRLRGPTHLTRAATRLAEAA
ncbi:MAG: hypothetical protein F4149_02080 [Gammaproteobacteria bacterium]|nr:hypothetical protein [Gammaproteobacteria bacterium]MYK82474.1 hypothetical protein [Gammaproteobacteria bacterium]